MGNSTGTVIGLITIAIMVGFLLSLISCWVLMLIWNGVLVNAITILRPIDFWQSFWIAFFIDFYLVYSGTKD